MRHLVKGRILNRNPDHRRSLMRNLACSLIANERIVTTVAKAKELRPFVERLITMAKNGSRRLEEAGKADVESGKAARAAAIAVRRRLAQRLGGKKFVTLKDSRVNVIDKLMNDLGPRFADRPGGYTRVIKRTERRLGDAAPTAFLQILRANETMSSKRPTPTIEKS